MQFQLSSDYEPQGDQGHAIEKLTRSLGAGNRHQTLLGVTGSGKTFTAANVIRNIGKPTLVISHNKTLAAQLYSEFKQFFPENAVEYFVSYFDYYQPEAYIPRTDTYIEKDSSINQEIERLRLSTTSALLSRKDVIVVSSVSCIYGLGSPEDYRQMLTPLTVGQALSREAFLSKLVDMLYERNDIGFNRGKFRVRGDVVEVHPANLDEQAVRVEFFGDEIDRLSIFDPLTGKVEKTLPGLTLFPAKQFVTPAEKLRRAVGTIRTELDERIAQFEREGKLLEAQRLKMRTEYDLEMLLEMGFCSGIENYTRHLSGRPPHSTPYTLLDFFPEDFLLVVDESHATIPQIGGMYEGDRSRKSVLVEYGFRLPSAMDNRPLQFEEFMRRQSQILYVSATPADFEIRNSFVGNRTYLKHAREATGTIGEGETVPARLAGMHATWAAGQTAAEAAALAPAPRPALKLVRKQEPQNPVPGIAPEGSTIVPQLTHSQEQAAADAAFEPTIEGRPLIVEQIIRPTGLLDPQITIKPLKHQIDDTIEACRVRIEAGQRALVTTLTKRTAEDLADYLRDVGLKVRYLHSEIDTIERVEILRGLRAGDFDVLVGINLLREGLDLPEVSLICILDADKEGYLRSQTSLIQTAGRAARHVEGSVILFADTVTQSMRKLIEVTEYRRRRQIEYNTAHGITPQSVRRAVQESLHTILRGRDLEESVVREGGGDFSVTEVLRELEVEMAAAAASLEYEKAALLRDQIMELKRGTGIDKIEPKRRPGKVSYSRGTGGGARGFNGGPAKRPALKFKKSG
jgi:excinuclease ABC subunit B